MKLSTLKQHLTSTNDIAFKLPNGSQVPPHFHITEIGKVDRQFIDCGGTLRSDSRINIQLWYSSDLEHRLLPEKLLQIIEKAEAVLSLEDQEIEIEYQGNTIEKFGLAQRNSTFLLTATHTDCLAKENCGVPQKKQERQLSELNKSQCCSPESNCC